MKINKKYRKELIKATAFENTKKDTEIDLLKSLIEKKIENLKVDDFKIKNNHYILKLNDDFILKFNDSFLYRTKRKEIFKIFNVVSDQIVIKLIDKKINIYKSFFSTKFRKPLRTLAFKKIPALFTERIKKLVGHEK